jgi:hypothetical protein
MQILFALAAALAIAAPAIASQAGNAIDWDGVDLDRERFSIETYQAFDRRLQDVGWKLVRGNAPFCNNALPSIGLQLQDLKSYGQPEIARAALGLTGDFAVQTAARGSPAALAGAFRPNREIARIGASDPNDWVAGNRLYWQRLAAAHDHIDAYLAQHGTVAITFGDGESVRLEPVDACASRFELMGEGEKAVADGSRVVIGIEFPGFAYEEPVFAGVVAHELAHNLLGHSEWLDRNGRSRRNVRATEREADRLIPWLLANAGYDPVAGQVFMQRWGPGNDGGLFRSRKYDGWDERAEFIAAEIPQIERLMKRHGKANWSVHFRREIDPNQGR